MDNGKQDLEFTHPRTSIRFNVDLYVNASANHKRTYTIKVEAKYANSDNWVPVHRITNQNSSDAEFATYGPLSRAQAVWLEDSPNTDIRFTVDAFISPAPQKYKITIAKPDIAFTTPIIRDPNAGVLKVNYRNSSSKSGHKISIGVWCGFNNSEHWTGPDQEDNMRDNQTVTLNLLCTGRGSMRNEIINIWATIYSVPGDDQLSTVRTVVTWPFGGNTLWHDQSKVGRSGLMGGLQILAKVNGSDGYPRPCTSSFTLQLVPVGSTGASQAISTTAHCASTNYTWKQGSIPYSTSATDIGRTSIMPTPVSCNIAGATTQPSSCRRGDQAYARSTASPAPTFRNGYIFKPKAKFTGTGSITINHYTENLSSARFKIVAARPPIPNETVNKVGRTTGWTSGTVKSYQNGDPACPGSPRGIEDNSGGSSGLYYECLTKTDYHSLLNDSGSPVFVLNDDSVTTDVEVSLVGVHWGTTASNPSSSEVTADPAFIPIDMIYAESLAQGYDWLPAELRAVPVLDNGDRGENLTREGNTIKATFDAKDFAPTQRGVLTYQAALFRNGTAGSNIIARTTTFTGDTIQVARENVPVKVAAFDIADLSGTFTVAVRACTAETTPKCGDYGSHGNMSTVGISLLSSKGG